MAQPVEPRLVLSHDGFTVLYKSEGDVFMPIWTESYDYAAQKRLENLTLAYSKLKMSPNDITSGLYTVSSGDTSLTNFAARRLALFKGNDYCLELPLPVQKKKQHVRYTPKGDFDEPKFGLSASDMERADISFVLDGVYYRAHISIFYAYARFRPDRKLVGSERFYKYADPEFTLKFSQRVIGVYGSVLDGLYLENRYAQRIIQKIVEGDRRRGNIMHFERAS